MLLGGCRHACGLPAQRQGGTAMPINSVFLRNERWFHFGSDPAFGFGSDYSTGPRHTTEFEIIQATVSVHTAISAVQATTLGPVGAAIGIMKIGDADFGPSPADWPAQIFGKTGSFTTATQVTRGEMN